jgi:predicted lipoprotein with Yx(FWY)xxD motif
MMNLRESFRLSWVSPRGARGLGILSIAMLLCVGVAVAAATTTIRTTNNSTFGRILEGPSGFTLYVFCPGTSTDCTGHRASSWPPLIAHGSVVAARGSRLNARKLRTRKLSDGQRQVTYYGQPLYLYKGDKKPGQVKGESCKVINQANGAWFVISNTGRAVPPSCY